MVDTNFREITFLCVSVKKGDRGKDRGISLATPKLRLVKSYLEIAGNFRNVRSLDRSPRRVFGDPLYAAVAESAGPYVGGPTG
jgi:hypothetical protein